MHLPLLLEPVGGGTKKSVRKEQQSPVWTTAECFIISGLFPDDERISDEVVREIVDYPSCCLSTR